MQLRRSFVTASLAVALVLPLSACGAVDRIRGFDYATDSVYTPAAGTNDRSGNVDLLGAAVVAAQHGAGTLVVSLVNGDTEASSELTGVTGTYTPTGGSASEVTTEAFEPVEVPAKGLVNLADTETPIVVTGDFEAGNMLVLTFTFADGQTTSFDVPVVSNFHGDWAGLDRSPGAEDVEPPADAEAPSGH